MSLNKKITKWKKGLHRHSYLEDGVIEELEDHLRSEIDVLLENGYNEEDAFQKAVLKIGDPSDLARQEKISRATKQMLPGLLKSFIRVAGRNFRKNKLTSSINLIGITTAFTALLFIGLFINDELSYEKHHPHIDDIYRLAYTYTDEVGNSEDRAFSSGMWAELLRSRSSAIDTSFRWVQISYGYVSNPITNKSFYEEGIYWSDPNFFDFLKFDLKYGEKEAQLRDINSIILTESSAQKIFGEENPIGKTLVYNRRSNSINLTVTGVIYDPPSNTQFQPDYIGHLQAVQGIFGEQYRGWVDKNPRPGYLFTYLRIPDPKNVQQVSADIKSIWNELIPDRAESMEPLITPLRDIHFQPAVKWEIDNPIDVKYLYGLMIIGGFVLLIALSNFINLTTALGGKRRKEIGLRKTLGSTKSQLRLQFTLESSMNLLLGFFLAVVLTFVLLPWFNEMVNKRIDFMNVWTTGNFSLITALTLISVLIIIAAIPSLYFTRNISSNMNMSQIFKKEKSNSAGRNGLVILQFAVAIVMVISTVTVYNQLDLINNDGLARNQETVIGVRTSRMGDEVQAQRLKTEINKIAGVESNSLGMHLPRQSDFGRVDTRYRTSLTGDQQHYWNKFDADGGFLKTYDLTLIAGRDFDRNIEPNALIVNEKLVNALGITPQEAIGVSLKEDSINYVFGRSDGMVVGVVKDFAYESVKKEIDPVVICANNEVDGVLSIRLADGDKQAYITKLEEQWNQIYPGRPFEYWFLNKEFDRLYQQERRLGQLIPIFSGLAIVIALLGLFALTVFIAEMRRKEIAIRKVLGSSIVQILNLLGKQFLYTLIPAIIVAVPVAYFGMSAWLDGFEYRVNVNFWTVVAAVFLVAIVSAATISYQSLRAALRNPVESLKYE